MTGILPSNGVLPSATQNGDPLAIMAPGCDNLYYPPRCNPRLDSYAMNALISEVLNVINARGEPYDCTRLDNLERAIRSQWLNYFDSTGTDNIVITPDTPFQDVAHLVGVPLRIKTGAAPNTGPMTLNVNGLGAIAITNESGGALAPGAVRALSIYEVMYDGVSFKLRGSGAGGLDPAGRPTQTALYAFARGTGACNLVTSVQTLVNDWAVSEGVLGDAVMAGGEFTVGPQSAGVWSFWANVGIASNFNGWTNKLQAVRIASVGPNITFGYLEMGNFGTNLNGSGPVGGVVRMNAGDKVRILCEQNTGSNRLTHPTLNTFSAARVGL